MKDNIDLQKSLEKLSEIECFLFDLDGTVYLEGVLLDGAKEAIAHLKEIGKNIVFLTNNSSVSTSKYFEKLQNMGLECEISDILTSGGATIHYLKKHYPGKSIYLVGTKSLCEEFENSGLNMWKDEVGVLCEKEIPDVCVLSYDKELTYEKLVKITRYITLGSEYIATHPDINCPADVVYQPDIGSFMALVESSTGKKPTAICGKPHEAIAEVIKELANLPAEKIAMVGDRLATDIAFGIANNFTATLVMTGETTAEWLERSDIVPDVVLEGVKSLRLLTGNR